MELIRSSEDHGAGPPWMQRARLLSDPKSLSTTLLKKEVVVPTPSTSNGNESGVEEAEYKDGKQQQGCRGASGLCALSCLVGRAYTIYVIQLRYKERSWTVRKRFRELMAFNNVIEDGE